MSELLALVLPMLLLLALLLLMLLPLPPPHAAAPPPPHAAAPPPPCCRSPPPCCRSYYCTPTVLKRFFSLKQYDIIIIITHTLMAKANQGGGEGDYSQPWQKKPGKKEKHQKIQGMKLGDEIKMKI